MLYALVGTLGRIEAMTEERWAQKGVGVLREVHMKDLDDQTEAGFAQLGQMRLKEVMPVPEVTAACDQPEQTNMDALEDIEMDLVEETLSSIFQ